MSLIVNADTNYPQNDSLDEVSLTTTTPFPKEYGGSQRYFLFSMLKFRAIFQKSFCLDLLEHFNLMDSLHLQ